MRKYLIAAIAALTAIAFASVAIAQGPAASMKVTLSPKKAGTKKHPRNSSLKLTITNNDSKKTLKQLDILLPKTVLASGKGIKTCKESKLAADSPSGCPKGSIVGHGSADALFGVNLPEQQPLHFDVTAVAVSKNGLDFYLHSTTIPANIVAPGRLKNNGRKLVVKIPPEAQQPAPGGWAGLVSLTTKIGKKAGKHMLISSTGCKHHKQKFGAVLHFADNGVTPASRSTTSASSKCS